MYVMKNMMIEKESAEYLQKKFTAFRIYSSKEVHDLALYYNSQQTRKCVAITLKQDLFQK